jgi:hypothetical protein
MIINTTRLHPNLRVLNPSRPKVERVVQFRNGPSVLIVRVAIDPADTSVERSQLEQIIQSIEFDVEVV